jgi:hypothetical protein
MSSFAALAIEKADIQSSENSSRFFMAAILESVQ